MGNGVLAGLIQTELRCGPRDLCDVMVSTPPAVDYKTTMLPQMVAAEVLESVPRSMSGSTTPPFVVNLTLSSLFSKQKDFQIMPWSDYGMKSSTLSCIGPLLRGHERVVAYLLSQGIPFWILHIEMSIKQGLHCLL